MIKGKIKIGLCCVILSGVMFIISLCYNVMALRDISTNFGFSFNDSPISRYSDLKNVGLSLSNYSLNGMGALVINMGEYSDGSPVQWVAIARKNSSGTFVPHQGTTIINGKRSVEHGTYYFLSLNVFYLHVSNYSSTTDYTNSDYCDYSHSQVRSYLTVTAKSTLRITTSSDSDRIWNAIEPRTTLPNAYTINGYGGTYRPSTYSPVYIQDKLWLLSSNEVTSFLSNVSDGGINNTKKDVKTFKYGNNTGNTTTYLYNTQTKSEWYLRSWFGDGDEGGDWYGYEYVDGNGYIKNDYEDDNPVNKGIRPAFQLTI